MKLHHQETPPLKLAEFLERLFNEGAAVVSSQPEPPTDQAAAEAILWHWEATAGTELAGEPPPFAPAAAIWAATVFYHACRFVICRDAAEEEIVLALQQSCPERRGPSVDWSVDLLFCRMPDLYRIARHLANADPLVRELAGLAADWPLSSVGIAIEPTARLNVDSFIAHPALKQLYVDRILERADLLRLGDPRVDDALRAAIGAHPVLCPAVARKLNCTEPEAEAGLINSAG